MEIAWSVRSASDASGEAPQRFLLSVEPPLSAMFTRMTGIDAAGLAGAASPSEVAGAFLGSLAGAAAIVAHSSRYEMRLLRTLPDVSAALGRTPCVCTAELAKRLLPGLSGYGLRAVAGYLGHPLDGMRSAAAHVEATALVWKSLLDILPASGPDSLADLIELALSPPPAASGRLGLMPAGWREGLPDMPGVYRLEDRAGGVVYVGRASSLRRRVPQHFSGSSWKSKGGMTSAVCTVRFETCETILEAGLLEAQSIEALRPSCNRALSGPPPEVAWFSRDLSRCGPRRRTGLPIGPAVKSGPLADLRIVCDALAAGSPDVLAECGRLGGFDPAALSAGLGAFAGAHRECSGGDPAALRNLARSMVRMELDEEDPDMPEPARVLLALESLVASAGSAERRACWYRKLACSTLTWEEGGRKRRIELLLGRTVSVCWLDLAGPACLRTVDRFGVGCIDAQGMRLLGVLTGEIRRLAGGRGVVELKPAGAAMVLGRDRLVSILAGL